MGGEDSEVRDETTRPAARGRELRRAHGAADIAAPAPPHRGARRAGRRASTRTRPSRRRLRERAPRRARGRALAGHVDVHGELPPPPVVRLRPDCRRLIGLTFPEEEQREPLERLGFELDADEVTVPTWRALDVTRAGRPRRGGRALPARGDPVDAARAPRDVRPADERAAPTPAGRGRARRSGPLRGLHVEPRAGERRDGSRSRSPTRSTWRRCGTRSARPASTRRERNRNAGDEEIALFEIARVYRPAGRRSPRSAGTSPGSRRVASSARRERRGALTGRSACRSSVLPERDRRAEPRGRCTVGS